MQTKSKTRPAWPERKFASRPAGGPRSESLPKELQLALVASLFRGELDGRLEVASRGFQVAHGLGERAEVEVERRRLAVAPQRRLPDRARIRQFPRIDHGQDRKSTRLNSSHV